jgi:hypothetical protein
VSQYRLDLHRDLARAGSYAGFPDMPETEANVTRLYHDVLRPYLE